MKKIKIVSVFIIQFLLISYTANGQESVKSIMKNIVAQQSAPNANAKMTVYTKKRGAIQTSKTHHYFFDINVGDFKESVEAREYYETGNKTTYILWEAAGGDWTKAKHTITQSKEGVEITAVKKLRHPIEHTIISFADTKPTYRGYKFSLKKMGTEFLVIEANAENWASMYYSRLELDVIKMTPKFWVVIEERCFSLGKRKEKLIRTKTFSGYVLAYNGMRPTKIVFEKPRGWYSSFMKIEWK